MKLVLEKGNTNDTHVDFVHWVGFFTVDIKISLTLEEWEHMGNPDTILMSLTPY